MSNFFKHETAIIDDGAQVGEGTKIWHWSHVCPRSSIGTNCSLGQNVYVGNDVAIGNNVKIQNNVSVYDRVNLEDDVFCGPSMVFTNVINPRSAIVRKNEYKTTLVKKGATIGANATIVCGVTLGRFSFIGAGAVVTKDVQDFALMVGVPAQQSGWMTRFGERADLPLEGRAEYTCPHTGDVYKLEGARVTYTEGTSGNRNVSGGRK
jgi:UDP-2-acetamido-3-amino-2,3-dideoxy-glucuronate N-acetyltransferase